MKFLSNILATMLIVVISMVLSTTLDINPILALGVTAGTSYITFNVLPAGVLPMALVPELWTGELIKKFRHESDFLSRVPSRNEFVNFNSIHLVDLGADPDVLINSTTYPIASSTRTDGDIVISLDKFDTTNTEISDDELNNLPYDKPGSVMESHRLALEDATAKKSAHSLAPQSGTASTPVVMTTGASNAASNARKRMVVADIVKMKRYLDDLGIPAKGRELVLCPAHTEDLLLTSQVFQDQFFKTNSGELLDLFGFKISWFHANPLFSNATGAKKAYGAAANAADDLDVSLAYYQNRTVQARGTAKLYHAKSENDPSNRKSLIGFRLYHICLPKKTTGFGAIVSSVV